MAADGRERSILLVEDNPADALIVQEAIEELPDGTVYEFRHVSDLRSAIAAIADDRPICVLLDLGLPDASGVSGVDRILLEHPDLPIVVFTGQSDPETAKQAIHHGAQDFLTKSASLSPELLGRTISYAIQRAETNQAVIESNQALTAFASMVAHDLRSPLSIASGMLELLERKGGEELSDDLQQLVTRSIGALHRASDLVSALLMYAQSKRPDEATGPVDLVEAAEWAAVSAGVEEAGATIDIDASLPEVIGGEPALRQVFQNLFGNAIRYADPDRTPHIEVSAERTGHGWEISVSDNGPGIPADKREQIFLEGERLTRTGDGFGLGLPAVRAIVERHGGTVWADDRTDGGPGTRMVFTLPG